VDELVLAQQAWRDAKARGERKAARAAIEHVVDLLRPRAQADLAEFGPQLYDALVELSSARLRGGDIWGSRAPAKEAKALAKTLGR
jgi:Zn-dependent M32 family carboxypeptidase